MGNDCIALNTGSLWAWNDGGCILLNLQIGSILSGDFTRADLRGLGADKPKQRWTFDTIIPVEARLSITHRLRTKGEIVTLLMLKVKSRITKAYQPRMGGKIFKSTKLTLHLTSITKKQASMFKKLKEIWGEYKKIG